MKKLLIVVAVAALLGAVAYGMFGKQGSGVVLGESVPADAEIVTIKQAVEMAETAENPVVVIKGKVEEKCPTSGCWFYLSDDSGRIRVDTQFAGFTVVDQKSGSEATVYGKVVKPEQGEAEISALGAEFK